MSFTCRKMENMTSLIEAQFICITQKCTQVKGFLNRRPKTFYKVTNYALIFKGNFTNWTLIYKHEQKFDSQYCLHFDTYERHTTSKEHLLLLSKQLKKGITRKPWSCLRTDVFTRDLECLFQSLLTCSLKFSKPTSDSKLFVS